MSWVKDIYEILWDGLKSFFGSGKAHHRAEFDVVTSKYKDLVDLLEKEVRQAHERLDKLEGKFEICKGQLDALTVSYNKGMGEMVLLRGELDKALREIKLLK